ncbi:uncharacterized protein LOC143034254 [Oratosquilla oratoria]|uniref:uncharacterized protein LOC143034254 n=1 Tax=Oratosquilla oratoria TaxID=337810 RepID=UPI003F7636AB
MRTPAFCSQDPSMWFFILECNFKIFRITSGLVKFTHAVSLLPPEILSQVSDILTSISDPPTPISKQHLLPALQQSLYSVKAKLSPYELANLAHDFMTTIPDSSVAAITLKQRNSQVAQLQDLVSQLTVEVSLKQQLHEYPRSRSHTPHRSWRQFRTKSISRTLGFCFYPSKFNMNTIKCQPPCTFKTLNASSDH